MTTYTTIIERDPACARVSSLKGHDDTISLGFGSTASVLVSHAFAHALATQLNEYLARFAAEKGLASVSDVAKIGGGL